jgi:hypothetical protein
LRFAYNDNRSITLKSLWKTVRLALNLTLTRRKLISSRTIGWAVSIALLLLGFSIVFDYGVSYDEYVNRRNGGVSLNYILALLDTTFKVSFQSADPALAMYRIPLESYQDRDYGVAFDLPALILERMFAINDVFHQYVFRHILTYLLFLVGCLALYKTILFRFSSHELSLCAVAMMVLSPRIFADSFYNSKDIVCMAAFAIATYGMQRLFEKKDIWSAAGFAFATAFAMNTRIIAIIFPAALVVIFLIGLLTKKAPLRVSVLLFYLIGVGLFTIAFWPWLWSNPVDHFALAFSNMSKFRWDGWVLYLGNYYPASDLPRHYLLTWILVSTPIAYLLLFCVGAVLIIHRVISNKLNIWKSLMELQDLIFLGIFFSPLAYVLIYKPVVYDGWRQFYFIYPAFICIAMRGLSFWLNPHKLLKPIRVIIVSFLFATMAHTCHWMVINHPFQNLYFNTLAPRGVSQSFELDYWGTTNVHILRHLLQYKPSGTLRIWPLGITSLSQSLVLLDEGEKSRIEIVTDPKDAEFSVTNFRFITPNQREFLNQPGWLNIYDLIVDKRVISSVFQKK